MKACYECRGPMMRGEGDWELPALPGVWVEGVSFWKCTVCGKRVVEGEVLRRMEGLVVREVGRKKTRLEGCEYRFLRKWLGHSAEEWAWRLDIPLEVLKEWEEGEAPFGWKDELLLRLAVEVKLKGGEGVSPDVIREFSLVDRGITGPARVRLKWEGE